MMSEILIDVPQEYEGERIDKFLSVLVENTNPRRHAIVWENDSATRTKELENVRQFYVFHTVMNWFGMQGPVYNEEMNLFEPVD